MVFFLWGGGKRTERTHGMGRSPLVSRAPLGTFSEIILSPWDVCTTEHGASWRDLGSKGRARGWCYSLVQLKQGYRR